EIDRNRLAGRFRTAVSRGLRQLSFLFGRHIYRWLNGGSAGVLPHFGMSIRVDQFGCGLVRETCGSSLSFYRRLDRGGFLYAGGIPGLDEGEVSRLDYWRGWGRSSCYGSR